MVQLEQNDVLHRLGVEGEAASFSDKVVAAKGILDHPRVYLERTRNPPKGDSGWYIGPVEGGQEKLELEAFRVYELLARRPSLLRALGLPSGYLVVFHGDDIDAVLNEDDVDLWVVSTTG